MLNIHNVYEAGQCIVEDRVARAQRARTIHRAMQHKRARERFRRSIAQGLQNGLNAGQLWAMVREEAVKN